MISGRLTIIQPAAIHTTTPAKFPTLAIQLSENISDLAAEQKAGDCETDALRPTQANPIPGVPP